MMYAEELINALRIIIYSTYIFFLVRSIICYRKEQYKKVIRILISYILSFMLFATAINVDVNCIKSGKKPIFCFEIGICKDGGSTEYGGLGYIIWKINRLSEKRIYGKTFDGFDKGYNVNFLFITLEDHTGFVPAIKYPSKK